LRRVRLILLLFFIVFLSISCYDAHEVDDYAYVTTIGVDNGTADKWRFSFQITNMRSSGSKETFDGKETSEYLTITIDAPDFFHAANILDTSIARTINFRHTKYIVLSRDIAEKGEFNETLGPIIRFREIRRTTGVVVSTGTAQSFIEEFNPRIGISMARMQEGLMEQSKQTGFFPEIQLKDFYSGTKSSYRQSVAILAAVNDFSILQQNAEDDENKIELGERKAGELPRKGGNTVEFFGAAVFDGDKMVAEFNGYETRIMLALRGEFKQGVFTFHDPLKPELYVSINLKQQKKPKVKVEFDGDKPVIHVKLLMEGEILSVQSRIDYEEANKIGYLEGAAEDIIKQQAEALIDKAKELNVDFLNFGSYFVKSFLTIQEWEKYNWIERMKDVKATVDVEVKIRRTGTMIKSSPIKGTEEEE